MVTEFCFLSLPPDNRLQARNMLLHMLMDSSIKAPQQKKYYDFAASFEMSELHTHGICGVRIINFSCSMDSPGREKLTDMQSSSAYTSCPWCVHKFERGLKSKCVFNGFRRWLPKKHPLRGRYHRGYMYKDVENRGPAACRTHKFVIEACAMLAEIRKFKPKHEHVYSHKGLPLMHKWPGYNSAVDVMPEIMHDLKCCFEMIVKCLVGRGRNGWFAYWKKDATHRAQNELYQIWPGTYKSSKQFPWRLSKPDLKVLDARVNNIIWPHGIEMVTNRDCNSSFWHKSKHVSKTSCKFLAMLVEIVLLVLLTASLTLFACLLAGYITYLSPRLCPESLSSPD